MHAAWAWLTVKVWPLTATVPVRGPPVPLATTEMLTVPLPVPLAGGVTVIHEALGDAVQGHPASEAFTVMVPPPPKAVSDALDGSMVYEHREPNWVMVCAAGSAGKPLNVTVPERCPVPGFEDTL
jgi:hypothetical protein